MTLFYCYNRIYKKIVSGSISHVQSQRLLMLKIYNINISVNTSWELVQKFFRFSEQFTINIRPHSLKTYCWIFKYPAGYWNYHVQSILAQNPDHRPNNFIWGTYNIYSTTLRNMTIMFRLHRIKQFCRYSNL